jgi:electron transport complex protein RnfC
MPDWSNRDRKSLAERVGAAGVVGMGGAGFPTQVKLSPPADKPIDTVIINGAECEPYLTGDHRLMLERAEALWQGAAIIRHILGAKTVRIAVEDNKPDAIQALESAMPDDLGDAAVCVLKTSYPQGSEKQQIYSVTGRVVPTGGLPMDVGCVVENVATTLAVWDAVVNGRPLVSRVITVSGDAITAPANLLAPIGTPFAALVDACGGARGHVAKIISGGPMMGFAQASLDVAMSKTSSGLLLLSSSRVPGFTSQPCIACGRCMDACPMRLMPAELSQCIEADDIDAAEHNFVMDCFECGSCAFVCPAHRPLVQHMRRAKAVILARRRAATKK